MSRVYLNADEAVEYLQSMGLPVTKSTLWMASHKGTIPKRKFKGRLLFTVEGLNNWIENEIR